MSKGSMGGRLTLIAVLIPVLGLVALVGRAEYAARHGPTWTIPIEGYDPRDLLRGRYLQYRFAFDWQGENTCGPDSESGLGRDPEPGCCLCLTRSTADGVDPPVRQTWCGEAEDLCDGALRAEDVVPPLRYYVPEERALELERALRDRDAALELRIDPEGRPAIRELLLDGRPWREVLGD